MASHSRPSRPATRLRTVRSAGSREGCPGRTAEGLGTLAHGLPQPAMSPPTVPRNSSSSSCTAPARVQPVPPACPAPSSSVTLCPRHAAGHLPATLLPLHALATAPELARLHSQGLRLSPVTSPTTGPASAPPTRPLGPRTWLLTTPQPCAGAVAADGPHCGVRAAPPPANDTAPRLPVPASPPPLHASLCAPRALSQDVPWGNSERSSFLAPHPHPLCAPLLQGQQPCAGPHPRASPCRPRSGQPGGQRGRVESGRGGAPTGAQCQPWVKATSSCATRVAALLTPVRAPRTSSSWTSGRLFAEGHPQGRTSEHFHHYAVPLSFTNLYPETLGQRL